MEHTPQRRDAGLMGTLLQHAPEMQPNSLSMRSTTGPKNHDVGPSAGCPEPPSNRSSRSPSPWQHDSDVMDELNDHLARSLVYVSEDIGGCNVNASPLFYRPQILSDSPFPDPLLFPSSPNIHPPFPNHSFCNQGMTPVGDGGQVDAVAALPFKHAKTSPGDTPDASMPQRYACPYNKWDPEGSPLCCMPSSKNPRGGAESFSRVKSHVLRNHDESVRCRRCWCSFAGRPEALREHLKADDCMYKARPKTYWMNEHQARQVRGQRFMGTSEEKWYYLFSILLPHVNICDERLNYVVTPYYMPLSERVSEQTVLTALQEDAGNDSQPSTWPFSSQNSALETFSFQQEAPAFPPTTTASPILSSALSNASFPVQRPAKRPNTDSSPGIMASFPAVPVTAGTTRPIPIQGRRSARLDDACPSGSFSSGSPMTAVTPKRVVPASFMSHDNERLRRDVRQLRKERGEMQRRLDAVRAALDPLGQMIEAALYQDGVPLEASTTLFAATERLNGLRWAIS